MKFLDGLSVKTLPLQQGLKKSLALQPELCSIKDVLEVMFEKCSVDNKGVCRIWRT